MEIRRAVLLFAIVLGIAALVTAVSEPGRHKSDRDTPVAVAPAPAPSPSPAAPGTIRFDGEGPPATRTVRVDQSAVVLVNVPEAGDVRIGGLGLDASAEPGTPARFDVLADTAGRHPVRFQLPDGSAPRPLGTLVVR